jgi:hypothetical protein
MFSMRFYQDIWKISLRKALFLETNKEKKA